MAENAGWLLRYSATAATDGALTSDASAFLVVVRETFVPVGQDSHGTDNNLCLDRGYVRRRARYADESLNTTLWTKWSAKLCPGSSLFLSEDRRISGKRNKRSLEIIFNDTKIRISRVLYDLNSYKILIVVH